VYSFDFDSFVFLHLIMMRINIKHFKTIRENIKSGGKIIYEDGDTNEGEWNNDKRHGKGILTSTPSNNNHNLILIRYEGYICFI